MDYLILSSDIRLAHSRTHALKKPGAFAAALGDRTEIASPSSNFSGGADAPARIDMKRASVSWRAACAAENPAGHARPDGPKAVSVSRPRGGAFQMQAASIMADDVSRIFRITDQLMSAPPPDRPQAGRSARHTRRNSGRSFLAKLRSVRRSLSGTRRGNTGSGYRGVMFKSHRNTSGVSAEIRTSFGPAPS